MQPSPPPTNDVLITGGAFVLPVLLILWGLVVGLLIERVIFKRLRARSVRLGWNHIMLDALRSMPVVWSTLAAAYLAITIAPLGESATSSLLRLLVVPFILSVAFVTMRLGVSLIERISAARGGSVVTVSLSRSLIRILVMLLGVLMVFQSLGIAITPIVATLGIGGLAVSLALQDTFTNIFSGLYILISKQTQPGDYVRLKVDERDHVEGYIIDITWRSTKIRTLPSRIRLDVEPSLVVVPNSRLASDIVVIHSRTFAEHEIVIDVLVDTDGAYTLTELEAMATKTASDVLDDISEHVTDIPPLVRYRSRTPQSVAFAVVLYGDERIDRHRVQHEVIKQLFARYEQAGVSVQRTSAGTSVSERRAPLDAY